VDSRILGISSQVTNYQYVGSKFLKSRITRRAGMCSCPRRLLLSVVALADEGPTWIGGMSRLAQGRECGRKARVITPK